MPSLIDSLNKHSHLPPDEIVKRLGDPFPTWRPCGELTRDEFEAYRETKIVICGRYSRTHVSSDTVEEHHMLGTQHSERDPNGYTYHCWSWDDYVNGVLRDDCYWFRSRQSYEANPTEGF